MGQSAQTSVMAAQMRQMGQITGELALQRMAQEHQAILAQVLFETDQAAHSLTTLATRDRFAAGVHARLRLNTLQAISPGLFHTYETKRAWAGATQQLGILWSAVEGDPQSSGFGRDLVRAVEALRQWQAFVGDPETTRMAIRGEAAKAARRAMWALGWTIATFALAFPAGKAGGFVFVFLTVPCFINWLKKRGASGRAKAKLNDFEQQLKQFEAFLADPMGGKLLDHAASRHPALTA